MADFCNVCAPKMGFDPDFNIDEIFQEVEEGYYRSVICEGCALGGIAREDGKMFLCSVAGTEWQSKEDYFKNRGDI